MSGQIDVDVIQGSVSSMSPNSSVMRNRIINGAMVVNQRNLGTYSYSSAGSVYVLDRFFSYTSQASKMTVGQSTVAPTGFINSALVTSSSAYSVVSGDQFTFTQAIEGLNMTNLAWGTANAKTVTLSFWVQSSLTGTFGGCIENYAQTRNYVFSYTIPVANTWTQISITVPGDTTTPASNWLTTNSGWGYITWGLGQGSTYSGAAGSWGSTHYSNVTGGTSVVGTSGATFYITGVQLEVGSSATSFEYRYYGQELALCQRYLPAFYFGASEKLNVGQAISANQVVTTLPFPVSVRTAPTGITSSSVSNFALSDASLNYGANQTGTAITFESGGLNEGTVRFTCTSGLVAGNSSIPLSRFANTTIQFTGCEL